MTVSFAKYDDNGRILFVGEVPQDMLALQGEKVWQGNADPATEWVVDGQLASRPVLAIAVSSTDVRANGVDEIVVKGVPAGAGIRVRGPVPADGVADGSDIHLTFALPGRYAVIITLFPYQDWQGVCHAA